MSDREALSGSIPVQQLVSERIRDFETNREWRLSLPAQVVIQQTFLSIGADIIGMGEFANLPGRRFAMNKALETLPLFLDHLAEAAAAEVAKREGTGQETRSIGAIFVLQYVNIWATMFGCGCWPRLP